jgi:hypothetical protein
LRVGRNEVNTGSDPPDSQFIGERRMKDVT